MPSPMPASMPAARQLVLASTSRYRKELLARLGLRFKSVAPDCDETPLADIAPDRVPPDWQAEAGGIVRVVDTLEGYERHPARGRNVEG